MKPSDILFRAKLLDNDYRHDEPVPKGTWFTGWYYQLQLATEAQHRLVLPRKKGFQGQSEMDIDPDTLCQFTGLHDADGKPIFQGDIIKDEVGEIYEVCWYDDLASFMAEMVYSQKPFMMYDIDPKNCKIIGNAFDNPELLK